MTSIDDHPLTCEAALDLLEPLLDGELPPARAARLEAHLAACPACAKERELAARIQRELRELGSALAPGRTRNFLLAAAMLVLMLGGALFVARARVHSAPAPAASAASDTEVARATDEARFALAYLGKVSRHTGLDLRDGVFRRRLPRTERSTP